MKNQLPTRARIRLYSLLSDETRKPIEEERDRLWSSIKSARRWPMSWDIWKPDPKWISKLSSQEIKTYNVGNKTIKDIREYLHKFNLDLADPNIDKQKCKCCGQVIRKHKLK